MILFTLEDERIFIYLFCRRIIIVIIFLYSHTRRFAVGGEGSGEQITEINRGKCYIIIESRPAQQITRTLLLFFVIISGHLLLSYENIVIEKIRNERQ